MAMDDVNNEEMVARRIVMRRETWDQLVLVAEALAATRELEVTPTDVATIALEAGLAEVLRGTSSKSRSGSNARTQKASRSQASSRSQAAGRSGSSSRTQAASRSSKVSRSVRRAAPALDLTTEERQEISALVADVDSARGRQRAIALWLGQQKKRVALEALRELCLVHEAYNVANFAQNMKKDGDLFEEMKDDSGERLGWRLTKDGVAEAKALLESVLAGAGA